MKLNNMGQYLDAVNNMITEVESIGEEMHPSYEMIRNAIDSDTVETLEQKQLSDIKNTFSQGTDSYKEIAQRIQGLKAPIKVIGVHKKFEKSFLEYVEGCSEMVSSIDDVNGKVDIEKFEKSEHTQDLSTDSISFCIQRITQLLLK